jgi:cytoskeletal protein RodZ
MSRCIALRLSLAVLIAAPAFPLLALAQSQGSQTQDPQNQSVADAARRAREQKKAAAKQPAPVITDDTLKRSAPTAQASNEPAPAPTSEATPAAAAPVPAAQPAADSSSAPDANAAPVPAEQSAPAAEAEKKGNDSAELAALKQQLAEEQKGLELLQRELSLQQDTYISNPDHSHDIAGKAKLDAMLQQITGKQQALDALKAQLAALQSSTSSAPPPPPNPPQF